MTLLIARIDELRVWMAVDLVITGGNISTRQREYALKIVPSEDSRSLAGFAGDAHHGTRLINSAAALPSGQEAISFLLKGHCEYPSVEFAYAYLTDGNPCLIRIAQGRVEELPAFHLGVSDAFEHFQRIRHDAEIDYAPEAVKTFVTGSRSAESVPDLLSITIRSMLRLFAERSERDVGGWVTPYYLSREGAFLCGYGYAVSDPVLTRLGPGSILAHGSAEAGGFGLSFTELGVLQGVIVYWLQLPGGIVFRKVANGYEATNYEGRPAEFMERASAGVGQRVEVLFSDQPIGPPQSITIMRDDKGVPSMAIAKHGRSFSFSVLNVASPFRSFGEVRLGDHREIPGKDLFSDYLRITISDDSSTATVDLRADGRPVTEVVLDARNLDLATALLGEARAMLRSAVPPAPQQDAHTRELMVLDPTWRTQRPEHPTLNGIELRLRHPGFGWLTFLIPWHEAKSLGEWLIKNSIPPPTNV